MDYDWARLHAALNDLPPALIVTGALLGLIWQFMRRDSLRAASYWMIVLGWVGTIAAVVAGLRAESVVAHGSDVHEAFQRHETHGLITLGLITVVALWRVARERSMRRGEQSLLMGLTLAAAGFVIATSQIGGHLVYDHALGIETPVLERALESRAAGHEHADGEAHSHDAPVPGAAAAAGLAGDSLAARDSAASDTAGAADHTHAPGTEPHEH